MKQRTSHLAVWSLILAICSMVLLVVCMGPLFAIPAVICGHMGLSRIGRSQGELGGNGLALGGLITGYISLGLSLLWIPLMVAIAVPNFIRAREVAMQNACINNLRQFEAAKDQWALEQDADLTTAVTADDIDPILGKPCSSVTCPAGGEYALNTVGANPTCTISDHTLEDAEIHLQPY